VVEWLDREAPADDPWFLFVGYMDPHDPYFPHPYDGTGYSRAANQHPDLSEADALRALYDGEITYWDEHFGRLMDALRERGVYDDTLIIVTSDHGEEFGEHGGFWHGTTLYDEQLRVPLIVKLPGNARAGTRVGHWVQSVDLMPSVLAQVGLDVPEGVQGGSLDRGTTSVYAEESHEGNVLESVRERLDFEELKLIMANADNPRGLEPVELYRMADDPGEQANVADASRDRVQTLVGVLDEARQAAQQGAVEGSEVEMDEESRRQLCQIGYIDAAVCCRQGLLSGEPCRGT
jgi:arylsulfatase A-like enzyme